MKAQHIFEYSEFEYSGEVVGVFDTFLNCETGHMVIHSYAHDGARMWYDFYMKDGAPSISINNSMSFPFGRKKNLKLVLNDLVLLIDIKRARIELRVEE